MAVCIIAASTTEYPCLFRARVPMYIVARARVMVDPWDGGGLKPP